MTLPANINALKDSLAAVDQNFDTQAHDSSGFIKFNGQTGTWEFNDEDVKGLECLMNPLSLKQGWLVWGDEGPHSKDLVPVTQAMPAKPESFTKSDGKVEEAKKARQIGGKFLDEDLGDFIFESSSMGGVERIDTLFMKVKARLYENSEFIIPKVKLSSDSYKAKSGNRVHKPVFEILEWCDLDGNPEGEPTPKIEADETPTPTTGKRKRRVAE